MRVLPAPSLRHARGITPDDGDGDDEHPLARRRVKIQGIITACVDTGIHQMHESEGFWEPTRGLPNLAPLIARGCGGSTPTTDPYWILRTACQTGSLDSGAAHATCCALGEATRDHIAHRPGHLDLFSARTASWPRVHPTQACGQT